MATTVTLGTPRVFGSLIEFPFTTPSGKGLIYPGGIPQLSAARDDFADIQTLMKLLLIVLDDKGLTTPAQAAGHSLVYDPTQSANVLVFS